MRVINYFGGPGTGKSTLAAYTFAKLKEAGINCEYVQEFAKDKTWEENPTALKCQPYIAGKQFWRLDRLEGKVELAITDSPLINSLLYPSRGCSSVWKSSIVHQFNLFQNTNIFLVRNLDVHPYNPSGRSQKVDKAIELDKLTKDMLELWSIPYHTVEINELPRVYEKVRKILVADGMDIPIKPVEEKWMI